MSYFLFFRNMNLLPPFVCFSLLICQVHGSSRPGRTQDICLDGFLSFCIALQILLHKLTRHFPTFGNVRSVVKSCFLLLCTCVESTAYCWVGCRSQVCRVLSEYLSFHVLLSMKQSLFPTVHS